MNSPETANPAAGSPAVASPRAARRGSRARRIVITSAFGLGFAVGGAGIAWAASSSSSTSPGATANPSNPNPAGPGGGAAPAFGKGLGGPGLGLRGGVLHGEFIAVKPGGGYQTLDVQNGTASNISTTSITVTSQDGYSHTYVVDAQTLVGAKRDGISSISNNDKVVVTAVNANGTQTAQRIIDLSNFVREFQGPNANPAVPPAGNPTGI